MNTNADKGANIESLFKNSLRHQTEAVEKIKSALHIEKDATIVKSYKTGQDAGKADVIVRFDNRQTISANIKSYKNDAIGFNQATRMPLHRFADVFAITDELQEILKGRLLAKAGNKTEPFIPPPPNSLATVIVEAIRPIARDIIRYSICGEELPELFVLWNNERNEMAIYLMHAILSVMDAEVDVHITPRGIISLNPYFTIQRKGGNGVHVKVPKTDIKHPGNNVQVKIKTSKFRNDIDPLCYYYI